MVVAQRAAEFEWCAAVTDDQRAPTRCVVGIQCTNADGRDIDRLSKHEAGGLDLEKCNGTSASDLA